MPLTVHVTGLPANSSEEEVKDFFTRVGDVTHIERTAHSVLVSFANEEDLKEALHLNGMEYADGTTIHVTKGGPAATAPNGDVPADPVKNKEDRDKHKVAVRQLPPGTTETDLRALFEDCGRIVDLYLDNRRHYAFIGFTCEEEVELALAKTGESFHDAKLSVDRKRGMQRRDHCVVVTNIPSDCTSETLQSFFANCSGEIAAVHVDTARGIAFVNMSDNVGVESLVGMNGKELNGNVLTISARIPKKCFTCNKEGHLASQCRSKLASITCRNCGRAGHIARDCRLNENKHAPTYQGGALRRRDEIDRRGGDRRRHRSDSHDRRDRRRRSDSRDRHRRRDSRSPQRRSRSPQRRSRSPQRRSRSPQRRHRRRDSRSRSPVRDRR